MRIIGGKYKSRIISMPKLAGIRPTQDKVRQAIFNMLGDICGMKVLELFAGSGAFGLEAISRGVSHVTFVENNRICARTIEKNIAGLGIRKESYDIIRMDAMDAIPALSSLPYKFDIIFMDPPYHQDMAKKTLLNVDACDILARIGLVVVERFRKDAMPDEFDTIVPEKERRYGDVVVTIYRRTATS
jgi:16S rRNA (guanine(966)-N(2))-methyltransferase RsmD